MEKILVIIFFILGVIFRLFLVWFVPQPLIFDQWEYHSLAMSFLPGQSFDYPIASYRVYGYPLILATIYQIFGTQNQWAWITVQAFLDTFCALMIYIIGKNIFKKTVAPFFGYFLYLFNPFTSAYVGVRLTEVVMTFFLTLSILLLFYCLKKANLFLLFVESLILGFLPYIRPGFLIYSLVIFLCLIYLVLRSAKKIILRLIIVFIMFIFFSYPILYNITRNLTYFGQPALLTVHNNFIKDFYLSLEINNQDTQEITPVFNWVYSEYFTAGTSEKRRMMVEQYGGFIKTKIYENPAGFVWSRIKNLKYVWEKQFIYPYNDPLRKKLQPIIYWGNEMILATAIVGYFFWRKDILLQNKDKLNTLMSYLFVFGFLYISLIHVLVMAAGRFTLPFYPIIFLFAGFGIYKMLTRIRFLKVKLRI